MDVPFGDRYISWGDVSEAPEATLGMLVHVQGQVVRKGETPPKSLRLPSASCCDGRQKPQLILEGGGGEGTCAKELAGYGA